MIRVVDLNYYAHRDDPGAAVAKFVAQDGWAQWLEGDVDLHFVKHAGTAGEVAAAGFRYTFFKRRNRWWDIPFATHGRLRTLKPEVVVVQGLVFPLQVLHLRLVLPRSCRLVVQHHGEQPAGRIKACLQRLACRLTDAFVFTAADNAAAWRAAGIIRRNAEITEILESSSLFSPADRDAARRETGLSGAPGILWVGRLNANKDPLTVLRAFEIYAGQQPEARLYMIFQEHDLLAEVWSRAALSTVLRGKVILVGRVPHMELENWFRAADVYVSGSHREGSGYAVIEAMACGCVPVVTAIPSFRAITGDVGYRYAPGDAEALARIFQELGLPDPVARERVLTRFREHLTFQVIALRWHELWLRLAAK